MLSRRDLTGALCGVAAGAVALAVSSIGGLLVPGADPPFQVLGDWVIRATPIAVTEAVIGAVGTRDKQLLLGLMILVAGLAFAAVGVAFVRGHRALQGIVVLAALPAAAALSSPQTSVWRELLVLLPAGLLGALVLRALATTELGWDPIEEHAALTSKDTDRRQAFAATGVLALATVVGVGAVRQLSKPPVELMSRLRAALPRPTKATPPLVDELASRGASKLVTPNKDFYRIDIAQTPPLVNPSDWTLTISRDGKTLRELGYDELVAMSLTQADITIGCVSNEIGGDLVGTARWQGVLLGDLLRSAGVTKAGRISGTSVDGFLASFAGHYAFDGRPTMVAVGMNDEVLPVLHGFPARLVVPGLYGYTSATKWLETIDVSDSTDLPGFWEKRGWAAAVEVHIASRIDSPGDEVSKGTVDIAGIAWSPISGVGSVEVRVDDGPWQPAQLSKAVSGVLWRQWVLPWQATRGEHQLTVRATDALGKKQDTTSRPIFPSGATGLHSVRVNVT